MCFINHSLFSFFMFTRALRNFNGDFAYCNFPSLQSALSKDILAVEILRTKREYVRDMVFKIFLFYCLLSYTQKRMKVVSFLQNFVVLFSFYKNEIEWFVNMLYTNYKILKTNFHLHFWNNSNKFFV